LGKKSPLNSPIGLSEVCFLSSFFFFSLLSCYELLNNVDSIKIGIYLDKGV